MNKKLLYMCIIYIMTDKGVPYNPPLGGGDIGFNANDYKDENTDILTTAIADERYARVGDNFTQYTNFQQDPVSIGLNSGGGGNCVAIGDSAGNTSQGDLSVAIGHDAAKDTQGAQSVAIGKNAGEKLQGARSVAIGKNAAIGSGSTSYQETDAVAIGVDVASLGVQSEKCVGIGRNAQRYGAETQSVAIGNNASAGAEQETKSIAIGNSAGFNGLNDRMISIGFESAYNTTGASGSSSVAIGYRALKANTAPDRVVAIGTDVGVNSSISANSIAIGANALKEGSDGGDYPPIAIGSTSGGGFTGSVSGSGGRQMMIGSESQGITDNGAAAIGARCTSVGYKCGKDNMARESTAIGSGAMRAGSGTRGVAIGYLSGEVDKGANSNSIGAFSAQTNQGNYALAVGYYAANSNQPAESAVFNNSSSTTFNAGNSGRFYIKTMRGVSSLTGLKQVRCNTTTREIFHDA
jgi:hypothetical protein